MLKSSCQDLLQDRGVMDLFITGEQQHLGHDLGRLGIVIHKGREEAAVLKVMPAPIKRGTPAPNSSQNTTVRIILGDTFPRERNNV
jgi:hypothetical protein